MDVLSNPELLFLYSNDLDLAASGIRSRYYSLTSTYQAKDKSKWLHEDILSISNDVKYLLFHNDIHNSVFTDVSIVRCFKKLGISMPNTTNELISVFCDIGSGFDVGFVSDDDVVAINKYLTRYRTWLILISRIICAIYEYLSGCGLDAAVNRVHVFREYREHYIKMNELSLHPAMKTVKEKVFTDRFYDIRLERLNRLISEFESEPKIRKDETLAERLLAKKIIYSFADCVGEIPAIKAAVFEFMGASFIENPLDQRTITRLWVNLTENKNKYYGNVKRKGQSQP